MNAKPIGHPLLDASTVVAIGAASASSSKMPEGVRAVRLSASADCFVSISNGGTAASAAHSMFVKATAQPEYFTCSPGDIVSVIQSVGAGSLYVTPIEQS